MNSEPLNHSAPLVEVDEEDDDEQKISVLVEEIGSSSFQIKDEDHTLGNALRYMVMKNPHVEFCGYSIPHPSENVMNIRIQIYPEYEQETRPVDALMKGLDDLNDLCTHVRGTFQDAKDSFDSGA